METFKRTKGVVSLDRLRDSGYNNWTREKMERVLQPRHQREKYLFIVRENEKNKIPSIQDIMDQTGFSRASISPSVRLFRDAMMVINFTTAEFLIHCGLARNTIENYFIGDIGVPRELYWIEPYVEDEILDLNRRAKVRHFNNPRPRNRARHYIALYEDDGVPCYETLNVCR